MNSIAISLTTKYDSAPAECRISCCGEVIFDGLVKEDFVIQEEIPLFDNFSISIIKNGKTLDMVHAKEEQVVEIKKIMLNGIPLKISAFGQFNISNNPYLKEERLQTNCLNLNGTWTLELPHMIFDSSMDIKNYQTDMTLYGLDEFNNERIQFTYTKAFPVTIGSINYSYRTAEEITSSMTFVYSQIHTKLISH